MSSPKTYDGFTKYGPDEASTYNQTRVNEALWDFENDFIEKYFSERKAKSILDAPVGTGRFLHYYPLDSHVVGLDVSRSMLDQARVRLAELSLPHAELVQGDIFHLDFEAKHFDTVVCWRLLHLLPNEMLLPALVELGRVLDGDLVAQVYLRGNLWQRFRSRLWRALMRVLGRSPRVHLHRTSTHIRSYVHSRQTLESAFAQAELFPRESHLLGRYYGHDVCVYVLERKR